MLEFGGRRADVAYRDRPGSYAVVLDEAGRIAVFRTPKGTFLPGGGADPGETEESTLAREVREEWGREVEVLRRLGSALEYVDAGAEGCFAKRASFFLAKEIVGRPPLGPGEADHLLAWLTQDEAVRELRYGSHAWAVRQAFVSASSSGAPTPARVPFDAVAIRALYEDEQRRRVVPPPGRWIEDDARLTRIVGPSPHPLDHMVFHSRLTAATADEAIRAEVERARRDGHGLHWNVFDGDEPADLVERLERVGLVVEARETVLVLPTGDLRADSVSPAGVEVRRVTDEAEFSDFFAVDEAVWGTKNTEWVTSWLRPVLAESPDRIGIFIAREGHVPVGCGWVTLPKGRHFAHLFGGTVLPSHRRRGVYRAIVGARARLARESGFPWLVTDANQNSAPQLRRAGFLPIASRTEVVLR